MSGAFQFGAFQYLAFQEDSASNQVGSKGHKHKKVLWQDYEDLREAPKHHDIEIIILFN